MEKASVLGIGRLGLCFALTLERGGYDVLGSDIRNDYVKSINERTLISCEPYVVEYLSKAKNFRAVVNLREAIEHSDMLFVTVRTESLPNGQYNHFQVEQLLSDLTKMGKVDSKNLVMCCNVNPGYCDEIQERLGQYGYIVSYNPEWVAQGTILYNQAYPDLVVIGESDKIAGDIIENVYHNICLNDPFIHRMDRLSAELTKIFLNCYLATKISYANMIGQIAIQSGVDPSPILAAVGDDSRINPRYFKYGFGYGGPCFPRDTKALVHYAEKVGIDPLITKAVIQTNENHLKFQVSKFIDSHEKDKPVVIDSVTYKPGTVIIEESQQLLFAARIAQAGYQVTIKEHPEVIRQVKRLYGDIFNYEAREV
jgi:nucleotide sugar dehydrogenase